MSLASLQLDGKTAVVVGGTSGIGRAISLGLAESGADVVASARRQEQVDETAAEIEAHRPQDPSSYLRRAGSRLRWSAARRRPSSAFGKVDILVNCAGKIKRAPTLTFPEDEWKRHHRH